MWAELVTSPATLVDVRNPISAAGPEDSAPPAALRVLPDAPAPSVGLGATRRVLPEELSVASTVPPPPVRLAAGRSRTTRSIATTHATAPAASTDPGFATVRIAAAVNGPMRTPAPSIVPDIPFAAVSSSGVRASEGSSEPWVGRVIVMTATDVVEKA